jgi:ATP-dependent exoDNAse (exonuclease V) alpha subunit
MSWQPLKLSKEFQVVLDDLEFQKDHFFITGRAGTGKSTLLRTFIKLSQKKTAVLAPTGIAALNAGGMTIHSFFKFPPRLLTPDQIKKKRVNKLYKELECLIIDEISMVRVDVLDAIDLFLRINRDNQEPFGGVQMILFGDLFQLPPVVANQGENEYIQQFYDGPYFFHAEVFKRIHLKSHELSTVYRQEEKDFLSILDKIRNNTQDEGTLQLLNKRVFWSELPFEAPYITLCATNAKAKAINAKRLQQLKGASKAFQATTEGLFPGKMQPTDDILFLKENAQVMFIKNDTQGRYVNGSLGIVKELKEQSVIIEMDENQKVIEISREEWEIIEYKWSDKESKLQSSVIGKFKQLPIKLAWAITIHKSQGKTFEKVVVDLGWGAFAHGQTYVALSRVKKLSGLAIRNPITSKDIQVDEKVIDFYQTFVRG